MIELHILSIITSNDSNLITLDLNSLINLNYLKLIKLSNSSTIEVEEEFKIIKHNSPNLTSNGYNLPYLKINKDLIINSNSILNYLLNDSKLEILNLSELNLSESIALHSYLNSNLLPLILNSLYSVSNFSYNLLSIFPFKIITIEIILIQNVFSSFLQIGIH